MMSSPSPPLTTLSVTPPTSAVTSPQRTMPHTHNNSHNHITTISSNNSKQQQLGAGVGMGAGAGSPVAVRAAVHRADITGQQNTPHTTPHTPPCNSIRSLNQAAEAVVPPPLLYNTISHHHHTPHTMHTHTHSTTTRTLCNDHLLPNSEGALNKVHTKQHHHPHHTHVSNAYHSHHPPIQTQSTIELGTTTRYNQDLLYKELQQKKHQQHQQQHQHQHQEDIDQDQDQEQEQELEQEQEQDQDQDSDQQSSPDEYNNTYPTLQYKSETTLPKRQIWQRSASCRDLYDFSFEDSGKAKHRPKSTATKPIVQKSSYINLEERKLESPITRYDESNRALYSTNSSRNVSLDIHQDIIIPGQKVYSSSYPGTTHLSQESMEDPGNYELAESQDDLSHDSYELLERSDDDYSNSMDYKHRKVKCFMNTRSCSLDSGNYLPTDSESDSEKHHKCKSSSDVHQDIFMMDDPRDLPREKIPRKSDGTFYKTFKMSSRTSSLESKSDYYDTKMVKVSSRESSRKSGWDQSFGSRTSSQESKSDYETKKPINARKNKSFESLGMKSDYIESRTSSLDSKSDYYDAISNVRVDDPKYASNKYHHDFDRKIQFERNYGTQKSNKTSVNYDSFPSFKETSHVHSISLQNVETEQNIRSSRMLSHLEQQNTIPRAQKTTNYGRGQYESDQRRSQTTTHIWPEDIAGVPTEIVQDWKTTVRMQRSTESESNIFSFDEDKIQSLQESDIELGMCVDHSSYSIVSAMNQAAAMENDYKPKTTRANNYRDVFMEIDTKRLGDAQLPLHQPIERTKSDPNSIGNRQRLGSNSRRHMLMHQKSIDLTPAESSDEDYLFKQIPSAPPITKYRGTHFEMPTAEFGHFDILKREIEGQKTKFEVPKSQFEVLGAKTQSDLVNLPPKNDFDIPYVLHKRHMMNGTAAKVEETVKFKEPEKVISDTPVITADKKWKTPPEPVVTDSSDECKSSLKTLPPDAEPTGSFLFTQNIDLSKIDPVTLEIDKSEAPVQHMASPKRDITKIDPIMLEALSSKLSQIESDSPTSSKTESLKPEIKIKIQQVSVDLDHRIQEEPITATEIVQKQITDIVDMKTKQTLKEKIKTELKPKRIIKPRMQPNKKGGKNKTKVRITSFSSDDESLDSDDVFGSAEATPTRLEFSPPQSRKEMEPILKYESERQTHLQYTMSSTEIEGSPPTTRKQEYLPYDRSLDPNYQTELRRISERSISIPSSEEDVNYKNVDLNRPVFEEPEDEKTLTILTEHALEDCPTITEDISRDTSRDTRLTSDTISENPTQIEVKPLPLHEPQKLSPTKPTIPEKESSPSVQRKKGQSPLLFAHARLNLSEGSAIAVIQRQTATTSPTASRRAKSLDTPIISVNKLPPLNAFSSKDDTVEEAAEEIDLMSKENIKSPEKETPKEPQKVETNIQESVKKETIIKKDIEKPKVAKKVDEKDKSEKKELKSKKSEEKDQIVPDVSTRSRKPLTRSSSTQKPLPSQKSLPVDSNGAKSKSVQNQRSLPTQKTHQSRSNGTSKDKVLPKSLPPKKSGPTTKSSLDKTVSAQKPPISSRDKLPSQRSLPTQKVEKETKTLPTQKSLPTQQNLQPPEIKRTKSQEIESNKRTTPKEKSKSFEKLEFKRTSSKERAKSQEDSDSDVAKRIEKQQMLYETAIKQTLKSPVKDVLPVFPTVEETVRVNDGKLEISIDTIETSNIPLEEAIIITKSPKRLDKKLTKSLELNLTGDQSDTYVDENGKSVLRLGKSLDLETRKTEEIDNLEFDFNPENAGATEGTVTESKILEPPLISETSPESDDHVVKQIIEAEVHSEPTVTDSEIKEHIVLEGTSLDIWLSVDGASEPSKEKLEKIAVIRKSDENVFFEDGSISKPPDLLKDTIKHDTKSSSESHSLERASLGNSLDIKYIDDSGDSSHKSEKDAKLIAELQRSIAIDNILSKKIEKIIREGDSQDETKVESPMKEADELDNTLVRITSEDESLTEVSDLKFETADSHLLGFDEHRNRGALLKLSIERSRSEDTTSWVTVECDEYVGADSFDVEDAAPLESPEKVTTDSDVADKEKSIEPTEICKDKSPVRSEDLIETKAKLLTTETKISSKSALLKHSSDHSRSSDTTGSWTSGEKDLSPGNNLRETGDESSVSCSIAKTIGLSQHIERFESLDHLTEDKVIEESEETDKEKYHKPHILERSSPIDEESSSASNGFAKPRDDAKGSKSDDSLEVSNAARYSKQKYPFEQKWASDSELSQKIHKKISRKLSSADRTSLSSVDDSISDKRWGGKGSLESKPTLTSIDKLSIESRNSIDTESSSGSLGVAARLQKTGEVPLREPSSTWRPFLIDSSGSESLEEGLLPPDHDLDTQDYFMSRQNAGGGEYSGHYDLATAKADSDNQKDEESYDFQDELSEFPANFGYPCITAAIGNMAMGSSDVLGPYGQGFLARTLSRISERSTNSENTSMEDDSTKASTQSDSVNDESLMSSDHQASLSSDSPSNVCADKDKKASNGSSEKKHKDSSGNSKHSIEQNVANVHNLLLNRQMSDDRRTSAEMADLSIDDIEIITSERGLKLKRQDSDDTIIDEENIDDVNPLKPSSSQESEDWPLPDIPTQIEKHPRERKKLELLHDMPSVDSVEQHAKLMQITPPHIPKTFGQRGSLKSQDSEQWPSPPSSLLETPVVASVESYSMHPEEAYKVTVDSTTDPTYENESNADSSEENKTLENDDYCEVREAEYENLKDSSEPYYDLPYAEKSSSISESVSGIQSGVKIVLETKSTETQSSNSEEDQNVTLNDDVFTDVLVDTSKNELRPPTVLRRSTTSDDSSHSGANKNELKPPSRKQSHSSYSEEECTSSMGTNFDEGTVRFALRPTKCTHSSHSEDTSVALSLSEWSNSTNTVKLQNLSGSNASNNSGATKSSTTTTTTTSGALRSDENSITDIAHSISDWSSSNSNTLIAQQSGSLQFQKLSSNTSTGDSTLTEMVPTISEWSSSDTVVNTAMPPTCKINTINIEGCLEQLLDDDESVSTGVTLPRSPENIPSEDLVTSQVKVQPKEEIKHFTKSTERPVTIPIQHIMSDTEKSTDGSSKEHQIPRVQATDKTYSKNLPTSKSTERPVKVPLKYSKCTPYYSSSLSSESTSAAVSKPISITKAPTIPLMRTHRKSLSKSFMQSPPSENDSTSSVESPIGTPETRVRGHRRRRQLQPKRHKQHEREPRSAKEEFMGQSSPIDYSDQPEKFSCGKDFSDLPSDYEYKSDIIRRIYSENVEEGYFPDGDSQSGSDIFRIENDGDFEENSGRFEGLALDETFDVSSIPPPLLEDDFEHPDLDPEI